MSCAECCHDPCVCAEWARQREEDHALASYSLGLSGMAPPWPLWPFDEAPSYLRALSENGGDQDWILVLPPGVEQPYFTEEGGAFGCCTVQDHMLPCARRVLIGCHA